MRLRDKIFIIFVFTYIIYISTLILFSSKQIVSMTENRRLSYFENISIEGYFNKSTQENIESSMTDQFINRDELIRNINELNSVLLFPIFYPKTLYGDIELELINSRFYIANSDVILEKPSITLDEGINNAKLNAEFYSQISNLVSKFYIYEQHNSVYIYEQYTNSELLKKIYSTYLDNLNENIKISRMKVGSLFEHNKYYYKTDHHFNYIGHKRAYDEITSLMGIDISNSKVKFGNEVCVPNFKWYGASSVWSNNFSVSDKYCVFDYELKAPYVWNGGYSDYLTMRKKIVSGVDVSHEITYHMFNENPMFSGDFKFNNGEENLLIIGDSFAASLVFPLAGNYGSTHIITYNYDSLDTSITEIVRSKNIDVILVLSQYSNLYLRGNNFKV